MMMAMLVSPILVTGACCVAAATGAGCPALGVVALLVVALLLIRWSALFSELRQLPPPLPMQLMQIFDPVKMCSCDVLMLRSIVTRKRGVRREMNH